MEGGREGLNQDPQDLMTFHLVVFWDALVHEERCVYRKEMGKCYQV